MKKVPKNVRRPGVTQNWVQQQPELFVSRSDIKREVNRAQALGLIRKLGPRLYTRNLLDAPEAVIRRHLWEVVAALAPAGAVVSILAKMKSIWHQDCVLEHRARQLGRSQQEHENKYQITVHYIHARAVQRRKQCFQQGAAV